jgi:predicted enzyme related to lactoylglutathione lyase
MGQPVVHFEIIGKDPAKLHAYFGELFGWNFDLPSPVSEAVSEPAKYGFVDRMALPDGTGIPGGVGGGTGYEAHAVFYVAVSDVEAALQKAETLGGKRVMGPERAPSGLVVGHFTDPEGNLVGVAGVS